MDIELPNGYVIEGIPEGTSKQDIMAKAIKAGLAKAEDFGQPAQPAEVQRGRPTMENDPRRLDKAQPSFVGSEAYSALKGAVIDPVLGSIQTFAERTPLGTTANLLSKYMTGTSTSEAARSTINKEQQAYEQGRQAHGREGLDVPLIGGAILSPVNKLTGGAGVIGTGAVQGAIQPVVGNAEDYLTTKTMQVGVGAIVGPLLQAGVKLSGAAIERLKGLTDAGRTQAVKDYLVEIIGPENIGKVTKALQSAQEIVPGSKPTAAQALTETPEGMFVSAAEKQVAKASIPLQQQYAAQEAARQAELSTIAGTAEQKAAVEAARQATGQTREAAIAQADTVKTAADSITKNVMGEANRLVNERGGAYVTGEGMPPVNLLEGAKQKTQDLITYQKQTLADSGFFPLEAKSIVGEIDKAIKGTSSDLSKSVLSMAREKILSKTDENGFISSRDLYDNVRKTLNQDIQALLTQANKPAQGGIPEQAAKAAGNVKSFIDASLNKSSNGLWNKYIEDFAGHSQKLDRMAIGQALKDKLGAPLGDAERAAFIERSGAFAQAVSDSASLIKKSTGFPRYDNLNQVLTPQETGSVNRVLADLRRQELAINQGKNVTAPGFSQEAPLQGVNLLSRPITLAKEVMQALTRGSKAQFNAKMAEMLSDPQAMAVFLQSGPISGQRKLVEAMNKRFDPATQNAFIQAIGVQGLTKELGSNPE